MRKAGPFTILYVDSDLENRAFLASEFEAQGFEVLSAEDAHEAMATLRRKRVHAVILDLELARAERRRLVAAMQSQEFGAPAVVLLVSPSVLTREDAYDLGASAALAKPIQPSYLVQRVRSLIVPASVRWSRPRAARPNEKRPVMTLSTRSISIGRGGFSMPLTASGEIFEGQSIEFDVRLGARREVTLRGVGVVRYVRLDRTKRKQEALGIEFESLDESSRTYVLRRTRVEKPVSFIPKSAGLEN